MILRVLGRNGNIVAVNEGKGLGIREHDDVMLGYGYSKYTWLEITIPSGQTAVIKITVPAGIQHHAEQRILQTSDENVRFKVYKDALAGDFPSVVSTLPVVNQREDKPTNKLTNFEYCGNVVTGNEPTSGELQVDFLLRAGQLLGSQTSASQSSSVKGRYSSAGIKAVTITNEGASATTVFYQYDWHEFEV